MENQLSVDPRWPCRWTPDLEPTRWARGDYQIALLTGCARWSGSDLTGKAREWSSRYRTSRNNLLARLREAGHCCEIRDHKNENSRIMRVLYVDGVAVSATS